MLTRIIEGDSLMMVLKLIQLIIGRSLIVTTELIFGRRNCLAFRYDTILNNIDNQ